MSFDHDEWRDRMNYARDAVRRGIEPNEDHWTLLGRAFWDWDDCEFGAPSIHPKRPYGNRDVEGDLAELLPHLSPEERVKRHCELSAVVQRLIAGLIANRVAVEEPCADRLGWTGDPANGPVTCQLASGHDGDHVSRSHAAAWRRSEDGFTTVHRGIGVAS
jgi:hypothetical protein